MSIMSNGFFLLGNNIYNKKLNNGYILPNEIAGKLKLCEKEDTLKYLPESAKDYLNVKGIIDISKKNNNSICVESDMNECRLFIQLTNKCNLNCKHCFVESDMQKKDYFTFDRVVNLINDAVKHGINRIDFTGGEVFTQSYFIDVLKYLDCQPVSYSFFTNLSISNEKILSDLVQLKGLMCVITSLDYFDEKKHNDFRGSKNAYQTTLMNILRLREQGVKVVVNIMVMNDNHDDVERLTDFFLSKDIEVHFDTVIECGRAKCNAFNNQNDEDNIRFINQLLKKIEMKGVRVDNLIGSCGVSKTLIFTHYSGEFMVCPGLTADILPSYALGYDLEKAWEKVKNMGLDCTEKECDYWKECSHGCRLRALVDNGSDKAPDRMMCRLLRVRESGE